MPAQAQLFQVVTFARDPLHGNPAFVLSGAEDAPDHVLAMACAILRADVVAVVESMKMETSLVAPFAGRVRRVLVGTNVQVPAHTPLLQLEAVSDEAAESSAERVSFGADAAERPDAPAALDRLRWALLGYDVSGDEVRRALSVMRECDVDITAAEHQLLDVYTDVRALSRARHDDPERELLHSPQEYLHAFLRSLFPPNVRDASAA